MAAKTWEADFRYPAVVESLKLIQGEYLNDPFRYPGSFCLPVASKPVSGVTPGKLMIVALVLGFALLGVAAFLASEGEKQNDSVPLLVLAVICGICGMLCFFTPVLLARMVVSCLVGARSTELLQRASGQKIFAAEISSPETSNRITIDGD